MEAKGREENDEERESGAGQRAPAAGRADASPVDPAAPDETREETSPPENAEQPDAGKKKKRRGVSRKFRYGTLSTVLTLVVVAAVVLVNVVASLLNDRYPLNLDLTSDKDYPV